MTFLALSLKLLLTADAGTSTLEVQRVPCPLTLRPPPACGLTDLEVPKVKGVLRAARSTCTLALSPTFAAPDALALVAMFSEGNRNWVAPFVARLDGTRVAVPDEVEAFFLSDQGVVGLTRFEGRQVLVAAGQCEVPLEGELDHLARLDDGSFVSIWTHAGHRELVRRLVDGAWVRLQPLVEGPEVKLLGDGRRAALAFSESVTEPRDFGIYDVDAAHSEVFGRWLGQPNYGGWGLAGSWVLGPPAPGHLFSPATLLVGAPLVAVPTLFRFREELGAERIELKALAVEGSGCPTPAPGKKAKGKTETVSGLSGVMVGSQLLLMRVESRGTCVAEWERTQASACQYPMPCREPPPPALKTQLTETQRELVLFSAGPTPRVLLRVPLRANQAQRGVRGFAALATDGRVRVFVDDTLLEFDAAVLEKEAAR